MILKLANILEAAVISGMAHNHGKGGEFVLVSTQTQLEDFARRLAFMALTEPPFDSRHGLTVGEQQGVLQDLAGLDCLINYHDCKEVEGDAMEAGLGAGNAKRALELLALGRAIIAKDPEIWTEEQRKSFALRHSEKAAVPAPNDPRLVVMIASGAPHHARIFADTYVPLGARHHCITDPYQLAGLRGDGAAFYVLLYALKPSTAFAIQERAMQQGFKVVRVDHLGGGQMKLEQAS